MPAPRTQVIHIQAQLQWQAHRDPLTGTWIATCTPLNINAVGDTYAELQEMAGQAMDLLFTELLESNELPAFLKRHGWSASAALPERDGNVRFDVPAAWQPDVRFDQLAAAR